MKSNLPLKLGIAVIILFGLLIAGMLAYKPLMERYRGPVIDTSADLPPELENAIGLMNWRTVSVNFIDTEMSEAIGFLRDITSQNIIAAPEIADDPNLLVTLRISMVPFLEALEALAAVTDKVDYGYRFDEKGEVVIIFTTPEKAKRLHRFSLFRDRDIGKRRALLSDTACRFGLNEAGFEKARLHLEKIRNRVYVAEESGSYSYTKLKSLIEKNYGVSISLSPKAARLLAKKKLEAVKLEGASSLINKLLWQTGLGPTFTPEGIVLVPPSTYYAMKAFSKVDDVQRVLMNRRISCAFQDTPLYEVISFLQDITGLNIVLATGVDGEKNVNINLKDVLLRNMLSLLCDQYDAKYEIRGSIIYILPEKGK